MASKNGFKGPEGSQHPGFPKGQSGNSRGSTQKVRIIKSPLRKTADSLREVEQDALEAIKSAVRGEKVEKEQLDTSKWVISTIMQIDKAASSEEISNAKIRLDSKKAQENDAGPDMVHTADVLDGKSKFSLVCPNATKIN